MDIIQVLDVAEVISPDSELGMMIKVAGEK